MTLPLYLNLSGVLIAFHHHNNCQGRAYELNIYWLSCLIYRAIKITGNKEFQIGSPHSMLETYLNLIQAKNLGLLGKFTTGEFFCVDSYAHKASEAQTSDTAESGMTSRYKWLYALVARRGDTLGYTRPHPHFMASKLISKG